MPEYRKILPFLIILCLWSCASEGDRKLPGVYRPDIQQGNVIDQEMIDKLKPGMDKNQVRFIMGTPVIVDPFHNDRWEYIYTYSEGGARREQRHITLYFKDEKLAHIEGDIISNERKISDDAANSSKTVDVPLKNKKEGFFNKIIDAIPFVGDDEPEPVNEERQKDITSSQPAGNN